MSADWMERASHLIEQSRKTAASVVVGIAIAVAIALYGRETWPTFTKLPTPLLLLIAGVLLLGAYSVAVIVVGGTIDIFKGIWNWIVRKRAAKARKRADEAARAEKERQLKAILPKLTTRHWDFLEQFEPENPGDRPSAIIGPRAQDEIFPDLMRHGFIVEVAKIEKNRTLYELTAAAAPIVVPFIAEYHRRMITSALKRAGDDEKAILQLFTLPDPAPGEPRHPWIEGTAFRSVFPLTQAKVLTRDSGNGGLALAPDAIELVEEMILKRKIARQRIGLDLSLVGSLVGSGSGMRSS